MGRGGGSGSRGESGGGGGSRGFSSHRSSSGGSGGSAGRGFSGSGTSGSSRPSPPPRRDPPRRAPSPPRRDSPRRAPSPPPRRSSFHNSSSRYGSSYGPPYGGSYGSPPPPPYDGPYGSPPPPPYDNSYGSPPRYGGSYGSSRYGGPYGGPPPRRGSLFGRRLTSPPPRPRRGGGCIVGLLVVIIFVCAMVTGISESIQSKKPTDKTATREDQAAPDLNGGGGATGDRNAAQPKEKLSEDACVRSDQVLKDEVNWLSDVDAVKKEMDYFYRKTGVQPYLLICDRLDGKGGEITDEEAETYLKGMYETLYDDEGHLIFVFLEYAESEYVTFLYTGEKADRVIDADAREIFLDNADRFYTDSSLSDDDYFAKIFHDSADQIMIGG